MTLDSEERERLLKFVVVGGGPTGVELAGTIAELARYTLARDFRGIDPRDAKIILVEGTGRLLPTLDPTLGEFARRALERLGVEVRLECIVTACDATSVTAGGQRIGTATAIWAAGVEASPVARWLDVPAKPNGTVAVMPNLSAPGLPHVFVIGDAAYVVDDTGRRVPGIAPAAKQQGRYVAEQIRRELAGKPAQKPFRYRHAGNLATIGRQAAVIDAPHFRLKGWLAWWIWGIAHIYFLIGMRSPLLISIHWLWEYLTYGRGARLITGTDRAD
jgi:NADH dehydrogenase